MICSTHRYNIKPRLSSPPFFQPCIPHRHIQPLSDSCRLATKPITRFCRTTRFPIHRIYTMIPCSYPHSRQTTLKLYGRTWGSMTWGSMTPVIPRELMGLALGCCLINCSLSHPATKSMRRPWGSVRLCHPSLQYHGLLSRTNIHLDAHDTKACDMSHTTRGSKRTEQYDQPHTVVRDPSDLVFPIVGPESDDINWQAGWSISSYNPEF
jgi:hypothetical protein